jgi:hypothetical protein
MNIVKQVKTALDPCLENGTFTQKLLKSQPETIPLYSIRRKALSDATNVKSAFDSFTFCQIINNKIADQVCASARTRSFLWIFNAHMENPS